MGEHVKNLVFGSEISVRIATAIKNSKIKNISSGSSREQLSLAGYENFWTTYYNGILERKRHKATADPEIPVIRAPDLL